MMIMTSMIMMVARERCVMWAVAGGGALHLVDRQGQYFDKNTF